MKHLSREQRINLAFVAFFCLVSVVWVAVFTTRNFENRDAYDYAQMGREIVQGHGLATKQIFPRHIGYLKDRGILTPQRLPNLYRYPLPTFTNALAQVFIADPIRASVIQCGTWFLLSIPAFFLLIRKLVDPLVALVCTIL